LWTRETSGGIFDTPERRAELEKTLRELVGRIRDESVRYHYTQEMRERVHAFFAINAVPAAKAGRNATKPSRRMGPKEETVALLKSSKLQIFNRKTSIANRFSLRDCSIVMTIINHPSVLDEFFEELSDIQFESADLNRLLRAIIGVYGENHSTDSTGLREHCIALGLQETIEKAERTVRGSREWTASNRAATDDARAAFLQAIHLHRSARTLHRELKAAEAAFANDATEENYRHLVEIQAQFRDVQAPEALIEGFGVSSGRVVRNF
jgi:DNA primase